MASNALVFVIVMVLGCAGFLFGVIYLVFNVFGWFSRGVVGLVRQSPSGSADGSPRTFGSCEACGHSEKRMGARFCSHCGTGLEPIPCVDQHDR